MRTCGAAHFAMTPKSVRNESARVRITDSPTNLITPLGPRGTVLFSLENFSKLYPHQIGWFDAGNRISRCVGFLGSNFARFTNKGRNESTWQICPSTRHILL